MGHSVVRDFFGLVTWVGN